MSEEWGPWIEHDGGGCPVVAGTYVRAICCFIYSEWVWEGHTGPEHAAWEWSRMGEPSPHDPKMIAARVIRYRIRKPRALLDLIERARELDDAPQGPVRVPGKEVVG